MPTLQIKVISMATKEEIEMLKRLRERLRELGWKSKEEIEVEYVPIEVYEKLRNASFKIHSQCPECETKFDIKIKPKREQDHG